MKKILFLVSLYYLAAGCGCNTPQEKAKVVVKDSAIGKIELYDSSAANIIDSNAVIEVIGRNYKWSEGPVWVAAKKMLLFSAVLENKIYKWDGRDSPAVYLSPSGYTDTAYRDGENGSNGLALDKDGNLLLCQSGNRQVVRLNSSLEIPKPEFTVLAANYKGKKFNSPNDLVFDKQGNLFFTDPPYGLLKNVTDSSKQIPFQGVYKVKPDGTVILLVDSLTRPNGIALSPDQQTLYVANSDKPVARWYSFHIAGDSLTDAKIFFSTNYAEGEKGSPDGLRVDKNGNLFATGPGGIWIFNPGGKALGRIKLPEATANCAFSADGKTLFVTSDMYLLRVTLATK